MSSSSSSPPPNQMEMWQTQTQEDLRSVAYSRLVRDLSTLDLPEVDQLVQEIAERTPAGNVPGMILNGLARIPNRTAPKQDEVKSGVDLLFRGVEQKLTSIRDQAVFGAMFGAPAAVISTYQRLLRLAGVQPEKAFPNGIWQFYVDYALRDDHARHATETHGFDSTLAQHSIDLNQIDRMTAWVMSAVYALHSYDRLLECEWRERVYIRTLQELVHNTRAQGKFANLYREWEKIRPYGRGSDVAPEDDYAAYRIKTFDAFLSPFLQKLSRRKRNQWSEAIQVAKQDALPAYQAQMSILAYLQAETYSERHKPLDLPQIHVAVFYLGYYYLVPICGSNGRDPIETSVVREKIAAIVARPSTEPQADLEPLAKVTRRAFSVLRSKLSRELQEDLDALRTAPIVLNFDRPYLYQPLAELRETERGVGDHPLTIIDTGKTFVFDQSHIFFDGAWGAALAEILTNEALAWGAYLQTLPPVATSNTRPYSPRLQLTAKDLSRTQKAPQVVATVAAESRQINLKAVLRLRRYFKQRNDLITLTVNDLLVLYRAIHAVTYVMPDEIALALDKVSSGRKTRAALQVGSDQVNERRVRNPGILIPIDASLRSPRDRLYPITFEVPLADLDLLNLHARALHALDRSKSGSRADKKAFAAIQSEYLSILAGFGKVLTRAKEVALAGESSSATALRLIANFPRPLQNLLDRIPDSVDVINDLIKGREVFSNVGRVAPSSSLTRFTTAKDDNDKKWLCWGVLTADDGVMTITLRDFRPHVTILNQLGEKKLARQMTQDYLDEYVNGLNRFIDELRHITTGNK